jgi:hypothetical protein
MTKAPSARLNARLPADLARKTAYLQRRLKLSSTEVIHRALERYYEQVCSDAADVGASGLADFVGCAEGPPELSSTYKSELARSLEAKR